MPLLRAVKIHNRTHLNGDRLADAFLQRVQRCADRALVRRLAPVRVRHIVNPRTVLPPDVVALPILRRRVNRVIEHIQQLVERYNTRIVDDMHRLRMSAAAAYLLIGRVRGLAVRIAALGGDDTVHETRIELRPPKASAREIDLRLPVLRLIFLYDAARHLRRCLRRRARRAAAAETKDETKCADETHSLDIHMDAPFETRLSFIH